MRRERAGRRAAGFTLIELLVVVLIISLLTIATLPIILPTLQTRNVSDAALLVNSAIAGARDAAIRAREPRGIRLLPDESHPGPNLLNPTANATPEDYVFTSSSIIAIQFAPEYSEGFVSAPSGDPTGNYPYPLNPTTPPTAPPAQGSGYAAFPAGTEFRLAIVEGKWDNPGPVANAAYNTIPNPPTSWYWNIRQGEKLRLGGTGRIYTVAGPIAKWRPPNSNIYAPVNGVRSVLPYNPARFVNDGDPTSGPPSAVPFEVLFLVNGQDDDNDGYVDESFDGIDNDNDGITDPGFDGIDNDKDGVVDNVEELFFSANAPGVISWGEWEQESVTDPQYRSVLGTVPSFTNRTYSIARRPVAGEGARPTQLPSGVVIDLTTLGVGTRPERSRLPLDPLTRTVDIMFEPDGAIMLGSQTVFGTPSAPPFYHFWVTETDDLYGPMWGLTNGSPSPNPNAPNQTYLLPMPAGTPGYSSPRVLKGERRLVSIQTRTGAVTTYGIDDFSPNNTDYPYLDAQSGVRDDQ